MEIKETDNTRTWRSESENYTLLFITLKPNFRSYIKRSLNDSQFMSEIFNIFALHFMSSKYKFITASIEYDSKSVCHIHSLWVCKEDLFHFKNIDKYSITELINFKRGIYVDVRLCPIEDIDKIVLYMDKNTKTSDVVDFYTSTYGFI